jgi:hypothetical protein
MLTGSLVSLLILILVLWLIFTYLIPLLPAPWNMIATIVVVFIVILKLLGYGGISI